MNKVLVIEDDDAIRENTAELLAIGNYSVITAENGRTGFEQAKKHHPDVVLCDMMMPETDGNTFLKLVRNDSMLKQVPIIFFSAGTMSAKDESRLMKAGNGFLKKPFLEEELFHAIRTVIHKSVTRE